MANNTDVLAHDGTIEGPISGIEQDERGHFIRFASGKDTCTLPFFEHHESGLPRHEGGELLEAAAQQKGAKGFMGRGRWAGALLQVKTFDLDFPLKSSSHFDISNAWPGAEILRTPFLQIGKRDQVDQVQLLTIEHGAGVFVCDRNARYIWIRCFQGQLEIRPAGREGLAAFLVLRARLKVETHAGLTWTYHALKALGKERLWTSELQTRLDNLEP